MNNVVLLLNRSAMEKQNEKHAKHNNCSSVGAIDICIARGYALILLI